MLESAKLKLERAETHITHLEREFKAFVARKPHRFGVKHDQQTGQAFIQIRFVEPPPASLALIIGDAVHNLRCALDHTLWELVGLDGGTQDKHLLFPIRDDRQKFEAAVNGLQTPSPWLKDWLRAQEAFENGRGRLLHLLHALDIADKHRAVAPVLRGTRHPPLQIFNADGSPSIRMEGNSFIGYSGTSVPIMRIPMGGHVELDDNADCPPEIFIPEVASVDATTALRTISHDVTRVVAEAEGAAVRNVAG